MRDISSHHIYRETRTLYMDKKLKNPLKTKLDWNVPFHISCTCLNSSGQHQTQNVVCYLFVLLKKNFVHPDLSKYCILFIVFKWPVMFYVDNSKVWAKVVACNTIKCEPKPLPVINFHGTVLISPWNHENKHLHSTEMRSLLSFLMTRQKKCLCKYPLNYTILL